MTSVEKYYQGLFLTTFLQLQFISDKRKLEARLSSDSINVHYYVTHTELELWDMNLTKKSFLTLNFNLNLTSSLKCNLSVTVIKITI